MDTMKIISTTMSNLTRIRPLLNKIELLEEKEQDLQNEELRWSVKYELGSASKKRPTNILKRIRG